MYASSSPRRLRLGQRQLDREVGHYVIAAAIADPETSKSPITEERCRPLFLTPSNKGDGRSASLADAQRSGRAFCIPIRPEIVLFDFDDSDVHLVDPTKELLNGNGCLFVEVASGGAPSRRHLYAYVPDEEERGRLLDQLGETVPRIIWSRTSMRPPGAPHRSGNGRATIEGLTSAQELLNLLAPSPQQIRARLLPSTLELLDRGPVVPDRSSWDMTVTWSLVRDGLSDLDLIVLAADLTNRYMEKAWQRTATLDYILGPVAKVRVLHRGPGRRARSRADIDRYLQDVQNLIQRLEASHFGGLFGRRVMTGVIQLHQAQHTLARPLAVRDVAEASSVANRTAWKYLNKLCDAGWLTRLAPSSGANATEYRLETSRFDTLLHSPGGCEQSVSNRIGTELAAFRHGYLNESGRIVAQLLAQRGEMSRKELIDATGLSEGSMQKVLTRLLSVGVVTRVRRGVYRLQEDISWEVEAEGMGADRVAKAQKQRNELERQAYGRYILVQRAAITGRPYLTREWEPLNSYLAANLATGEMKRPILEI